ncbi:peptide MFS transporter [uncultured Clostridium sp.]|uniref:peptide MFS transporter n=1 Tax=uncultured Clostridium sp. TaxID=59620 RepID=UPI0026130C8E|nr:peptide MFS transporter [uncultured Clostridium sp.]
MEASVGNQKNKKLKHPPGLYLLFLTEMWERFSYYGMRSLLILYLTATFVQGGLGFDVSTGAMIYGLYTGFTYFTPIIGGYLADKYLGQKLAIIIGGTVMALGNLALFGLSGKTGLFIGLGALIIGNGFFKPNISTVVGQLYDNGDKRKDSAFTIFYMGINIGSLIAPIICGLLAENIFAHKINGVIVQYGFKYGFLAAAIGMVIGQVVFIIFAPKYLGHVGGKKVVSKTEKLEKKPLTKQEKKRTLAILILAMFVVFFWAGFEQAGSSLTMFAEKLTDRHIFGTTVPVTFFQSINPIFVLLLSPIFAKIWFTLANRRQGDLKIPTKMALGMVTLGIGFLVMVFATMSIGSSENPVMKASMWWLVMTYFFNTVGELCLSPIGLSMVSKIAPVKLASLLMGAWLASSGVASILGGFIASNLDAFGATEIFAIISGVSIVLGLVLFFLSPKISKMME